MIRPYKKEDKDELTAILRLLTPRYFALSEEKDFIGYLDHQAEQYFVVEEGGKIIAAGGVNYFPENKVARLSWDMVRPDFQGKGFGNKLSLYRIDRIKKNPTIRHIVVRTTQQAYVFYQKLGFELVKTEKDFWAKGFDLHEMRLGIE